MQASAALGPGMFAPPSVEWLAAPDDPGAMILRSALAPEPHSPSLFHLLQATAATAPDRVFLAERHGGSGWRTVTYGEAAATVERLARGLLARGVTPERPLAILSDNAVNQALLTLAAMAAGVPVSPISPAYSRLKDLTKLRLVFEALTPGLVYAAEGVAYRRALAMAQEMGAALATDAGEAGVLSLADLLRAGDKGGSLPEIGPDTIAKVLFTSGSTDRPKGVITTHRMMCGNQEALAQVWRFAAEEPPVLVDWLPWNHVFGGSFVLNFALRHGGTLHIDNGRPAPGLIDETVRNLREVAPTVYFNVPRGFDLLVYALERDEALARNFFSRVRLMMSAGAALPESVWRRLEAVAARWTDRPVPMTSAWGSTETAPCVTAVHFTDGGPANIGLPVPGAELKFVPNGGRLEMRVRGPMITPGYWRRPDLTEAAFDPQGFYRIGDAGRLIDPRDPSKGVAFDGRVVEDFKLTSGTFVHVGKLRLAAIAAAAPIIEDAVVTGHDQDEIGLLIFPSLAGCRSFCGAPEASLAELVARPEVRRHVQETLSRLGAGGGSSTQIKRAYLLAEPPSVEAGDITDKGYINQRAVLTRLAALVETLHRTPAPEGVMVIG